MHNIVKLADIIIVGLNDSYTSLSASKCVDFNSTHKIAISVSKDFLFPYISKNHIYVYASIVDFVDSKLPPFYRSHLVLSGWDDSSNITYWEVV